MSYVSFNSFLRYILARRFEVLSFIPFKRLLGQRPPFVMNPTQTRTLLFLLRINLIRTLRLKSLEK